MSLGNKSQYFSNPSPPSILYHIQVWAFTWFYWTILFWSNEQPLNFLFPLKDTLELPALNPSRVPSHPDRTCILSLAIYRVAPLTSPSTMAHHPCPGPAHRQHRDSLGSQPMSRYSHLHVFPPAWSYLRHSLHAPIWMSLDHDSRHS